MYTTSRWFIGIFIAPELQYMSKSVMASMSVQWLQQDFKVEDILRDFVDAILRWHLSSVP